MTFLPRLFVVALAVYSATALIASATLLLGWRRVSGAGSAGADRIFQCRLLPAAAASVASVLGTLAFTRFEPRAGIERTGVVLPLLAAFAVMLLATAVVRLAAGWLTTRRTLRTWMASGTATSLPDADIPVYAVTSDFPIVAIVGVVRPKMIIARSVLEVCSPSQVRAIVAHERWHYRRADNARRALLFAAPDLLTWLPFAQRAGHEWHLAAEQAADRAAAASSPTGRFDLADALVQVARLATARKPPASMPVSALYRGENIETRVRRILDAPPAAAPATTFSGIAMAAALVIALGLVALHPIHELVETAVTCLP